MGPLIRGLIRELERKEQNDNKCSAASLPALSHSTNKTRRRAPQGSHEIKLRVSARGEMRTERCHLRPLRSPPAHAVSISTAGPSAATQGCCGSGTCPPPVPPVTGGLQDTRSSVASEHGGDICKESGARQDFADAVVLQGRLVGNLIPTPALCCRARQRGDNANLISSSLS